MVGNLFLRTSVCFLIVGIALGLFMGIKEDFTQAPTHAHINLVGGVWMFLTGLFYNAHPQLSKKLMLVHYWVAVVGLLLLIPGIYGAQIHTAWYGPVVGIGSLLTAAQILILAYMVFKATGKAKG